MPNFDVVKTVKVEPTFRNASVIGMFDLQPDAQTERFAGSFDFPEQWQVGVIVGNSGTGKSTIAGEIFGPESLLPLTFPPDVSILDAMPRAASMEQITGAFNSVGFSSPPSWLKPYAVLSNGQKMRTDLAFSILKDDPLIVFDEFTSVVDRTVAQIGSLAVQKAIRRTNKQFVAVTCHFDVIPWLMPDWVFDTNDMTFRVVQQKKARNSRRNIPGTGQGHLEGVCKAPLFKPFVQQSSRRVYHVRQRGIVRVYVDAAIRSPQSKEHPEGTSNRRVARFSRRWPGRVFAGFYRGTLPPTRERVYHDHVEPGPCPLHEAVAQMDFDEVRADDIGGKHAPEQNRVQ